MRWLIVGRARVCRDIARVVPKDRVRRLGARVGSDDIGCGRSFWPLGNRSPVCCLPTTRPGSSSTTS